MANKELLKKVADIPLARPGFNSLDMTAPILVQMNPQGKWENTKPNDMDEKTLKTIVQFLVKSKTIAAAQSYCCQCASNQVGGATSSNFVPVIMMPLRSADGCPFDMEAEVDKIKDAEAKAARHTNKKGQKAAESGETALKKPKKRPFVMQRLGDFDLLSQW